MKLLTKEQQEWYENAKIAKCKIKNCKICKIKNAKIFVNKNLKISMWKIILLENNIENIVKLEINVII